MARGSPLPRRHQPDQSTADAKTPRRADLQPDAGVAHVVVVSGVTVAPGGSWNKEADGDAE